MSLAWRFPHSARLDSTHAGLPLDACDVPAATSNHSHPAFLLVVEDVFVSFPAGYGVHVFQHGFSVHMSHLHSRKDTVSMHLHALSWFCSSLVAAANWRFKFLRSSFSTATLSAAAGGAAAAAAFASAADMALKAGEQQACSTQTACSPQDDPVFSLCLPGTSFSPLFTTPETWLRECDKMVMHRCTLIVYICMMCVCTCVIHYTHQTKIHKPMCTYIVVVIIYIYYSHDMTKQKS